MNEDFIINVNVVEKYKSLADGISFDKKHLIKGIIVHGFYNCEKNDSFIKSICNTVDDNGHRTGGRLEFLDLSRAKIIERYDSFYQLKRDSFAGCCTLQRIILSELFSLDPSCFKGCVSLSTIEYTGNKKYKTDKGILYQEGDYVVYPDNYRSFGACKWSLVKYPPAKKETKDIKSAFLFKIEDYAFEDFTGSDLYMPEIPPSCTKDAFFNVDISKIKIHVPKKAFNSYWSHPVWGEFQIIEDEE